MKNFSHKKTWNVGETQVHVKPTLIPLIKIKHDDKSGKDFVELKLCRYQMRKNSDLYEFNMALFENGEPK